MLTTHTAASFSFGGNRIMRHLQLPAAMPAVKNLTAVQWHSVSSPKLQVHSADCTPPARHGGTPDGPTSYAPPLHYAVPRASTSVCGRKPRRPQVTCRFMVQSDPARDHGLHQNEYPECLSYFFEAHHETEYHCTLHLTPKLSVTINMAAQDICMNVQGYVKFYFVATHGVATLMDLDAWRARSHYIEEVDLQLMSSHLPNLGSEPCHFKLYSDHAAGLMVSIFTKGDPHTVSITPSNEQPGSCSSQQAVTYEMPAALPLGASEGLSLFEHAYCQQIAPYSRLCIQMTGITALQDVSVECFDASGERADIESWKQLYGDKLYSMILIEDQTGQRESSSEMHRWKAYYSLNGCMLVACQLMSNHGAECQAAVKVAGRQEA